MSSASALLLSVLTSCSSVSARPNAAVRPSSETWISREQLDENSLLATVERYIAWGSAEGTLMPDCDRFAHLFGPNGSWISPFAVPNGYTILEVEKTCNELIENLTWHSASLTAGKHLYPFYNQDRKLERVAFGWRAVGASKSYREFFKRKEYDFAILSTLTLYNETTLFNGNDISWPYSEGTTPPELLKLIDGYVMFQNGDCKEFPGIFWRKFGPVVLSGGGDYFESQQLSEYCYKMLADWSTYIYHIHSVSYSVSGYTGVVDRMAFTWSRTGIYKGLTRTENVLTVFSITMDDTPAKQLTIDDSTEFFDPY